MNQLSPEGGLLALNNSLIELIVERDIMLRERVIYILLFIYIHIYTYIYLSSDKISVMAYRASQDRPSILVPFLYRIFGLFFA